MEILGDSFLILSFSHLVKEAFSQSAAGLGSILPPHQRALVKGEFDPRDPHYYRLFIQCNLFGRRPPGPLGPKADIFGHTEPS